MLAAFQGDLFVGGGIKTAGPYASAFWACWHPSGPPIAGDANRDWEVGEADLCDLPYG
ncbi:MAG: hypothetical protein U1D55_15690 [Phycisphaerae bacterium]